MNEFQRNACLLMARTFVYEYIRKHELSKKDFPLAHEYCNKLGSLAATMLKKKGNNVERIAKTFSAYVLDRLDPIAKSLADKYNVKVDKDGNIKMEGDLLLMSVNFVFLLIEDGYFKGSNAMYFKRISLEIYSAGEKELDRLTIKSTNVLASKFQEKMIEENKKD